MRKNSSIPNGPARDVPLTDKQMALIQHVNTGVLQAQAAAKNEQDKLDLLLSSVLLGAGIDPAKIKGIEKLETDPPRLVVRV